MDYSLLMPVHLCKHCGREKLRYILFQTWMHQGVQAAALVECNLFAEN
jgi:hypothetical protein